MHIKIKKYKEHPDRKYLQVVESFRQNGKVKKKTILNLGRFDNEEALGNINNLLRILLPLTPNHSSEINLLTDLSAKETKQLGPLLVFQKLWNELKLDAALKKSLSSIKTFFDIEKAIFNLVLNRLTAPSSKRMMNVFQDTVYGLTKFDLHQYYRAMDYLIEHKDSIEKNIFGAMKKQVKGKVNMALFDTTSIVYYGEDPKEKSELLNFGFSKARRSDLKQIVIGVLMSEDGVPLGHETFAGNCNDVTCFKEMIGKAVEKYGIEKLIWVGDRGMISNKNLELLESMGLEYILGYRMRTIPKSDRLEIFDKVDLKNLRNTKLKYKEIDYKGKRLIFCYNEDRAKLDAEHREKILEKLRDKLKTGKIATLIENQHFKKYLNVEGKSPELSEEKIKRDELFDGVFVLTSNAVMKGPQVVEAYKGLWQVEQGFRQLKDELELGPLYHYTDSRIKAHVMICFLALIMRRMLDKKLKKLEKELSYSESMNDLKRLDVVEIKIKNEEMHLLTEIKEGAKKIFKAMQMKLPEKIQYQSSSFPQIVVPRI